MPRGRQHWTVELLEEVIAAVGDKLAVLHNTEGADRARVTQLQQSLAALRADRDNLERREERRVAR